MPEQKTDDDIAEGILRAQKEQELRAKAEELQQEQRQRIEEAKERIRARSKRTYTVKAGDTLAKIAQEVYGDGGRWKEIYEANKDEIADPNVIQVGQVLVIP